MLGIHLKQFRSLVRLGKFPGAVDMEGVKAARWLVEDVDAYLHLAGRLKAKKTKNPRRSNGASSAQ